MDEFEWVKWAEELTELDRLAKAGITQVPTPKLIADFVRLQRAMVGWQQGGLAEVAGVSVSTIQRIERGEAVSTNSLDRVACALGQKSGAFTEPRVPLTIDQLERKLEESARPFAETIEVPVRPLRTQPQVAALARAHFYLIDDSRLGEGFEEEIAALGEVLGFVSFALGSEDEDSIIHLDHVEPIRRRQLYALVLDMVGDIERRARAVALVGAYAAHTDLPELLPVAEVGLISFFRRRTDPGAAKRRVLFSPAQIDLRPGLQSAHDDALRFTARVAAHGAGVTPLWS